MCACLSVCFLCVWDWYASSSYDWCLFSVHLIRAPRLLKVVQSYIKDLGMSGIRRSMRLWVSVTPQQSLNKVLTPALPWGVTMCLCLGLEREVKCCACACVVNSDECVCLWLCHGQWQVTSVVCCDCALDWTIWVSCARVWPVRSFCALCYCTWRLCFTVNLSCTLWCSLKQENPASGLCSFVVSYPPRVGRIQLWVTSVTSETCCTVANSSVRACVS